MHTHRGEDVAPTSRAQGPRPSHTTRHHLSQRPGPDPRPAQLDVAQTVLKVEALCLSRSSSRRSTAATSCPPSPMLTSPESLGGELLFPHGFRENPTWGALPSLSMPRGQPRALSAGHVTKDLTRGCLGNGDLSPHSLKSRFRRGPSLWRGDAASSPCPHGRPSVRSGS